MFSAWFNIETILIFPFSIFVFLILRMISDYFPVDLAPTGLCDADPVFSVGRN
jgi:hypothetical protein